MSYHWQVFELETSDGSLLPSSYSVVVTNSIYALLIYEYSWGHYIHPYGPDKKTVNISHLRGTGGSKYKTNPSGGVVSAMVVKTYIYKTYIRHRRGHPIGTIDTTRDTINRNYSLQLTWESENQDLWKRYYSNVSTNKDNKRDMSHEKGTDWPQPSLQEEAHQPCMT